MKSIASIGLLVLCSFGWAQEQQPQPAPAKPAEPPKPAAPPKSQVGRSTFEENESVWSLSAFYWKPQSNDFSLVGGKLSPDPVAQTIDFAGKPKQATGIILTAPTGRSNRLEFTVWEAKSSGSVTASRDLNFFGTGFDQGQPLVTENRIRSAKVTWNYLSYPYPPLDSKFRIKTLWEFQWVQARPIITAPLTADPLDNTPATRATGTRSVLMPTLGLGMEWIPSAKHFRIEARGTAMAFPGKAQIWDTEGTAVLRLGGLEIFAGGKLFHFRSTPNNNQYVEGDLWGPFGGLRWVFR